MATFKYIAQTKESNVTLNDVLTTGNTSEGTSYYNESSDTQYVYVQNAPLVKFLAKDVFQASVNDTNPYVTLDINPNFTLQKTEVDILKYTVPFAPEGQTATGRIECNYKNVTKDTFQDKALVSEVTDTKVGSRFLIAIPSTRDDANSEWKRAEFTNLFKLIKSPNFRPDINVGASTARDGNVIITFNGRVKVAITDVKNSSNVVLTKGNTIKSDGTNLTVVCTDDLYNEISKNGISSIKLEIVDNRSVKPITMASGEGFVGE